MKPIHLPPAWPALICAAVLALAACGGGVDEPVAESRARPLSVSSAPLSSIPEYTVTNIGLGGSSGWVQTQGINASGQVAGHSYLPNSPFYRAFFFDGSASIDLGTFGGSYSGANALNDSGQVVGYARDAGGYNQAFSWKAATGMVSILPSIYSSNAQAINNSGLVVGSDASGGFAWSEAGGYQSFSNFYPSRVNASGQMAGSRYDPVLNRVSGAFRQVDGTVINVEPSTPTYYWSDANLLNDQGLVGGYGYGSDYNNIVYAWKDGVSESFGQLLVDSGSLYSYTMDLNQAGQMVGYSSGYDSLGNYYQRGFLRTATSLIADIGTLSGGGGYTVPYAINNHGQMVGYAYSANWELTAFTWTAATGVVDLHTRLSNPPPGLQLYYALAISDNGSIVAYGNTGLVLLKPVVAGPPPTASALGPINANDPVAVGSAVNVSLAFTDVNTSDTHTAKWAWGDASGNSDGSVTESGGAGSVTGSHVYTSAGVYKLSVTVTDNADQTATVSRDLVVYDPSAGFVTGGGWILSPMGAYKAEAMLAGRATFGFVSKYQKGASVPTGQTEFQFQAAKLNFHSSTYDWLVVAGARAQYKGVGTLNGKPGYKFMLTAVDGALLAKGTPDRFRIKIWHFDSAQDTDVIDYDNQVDASLAGGNNEGTVIGGGSIVIHK